MFGGRDHNRCWRRSETGSGANRALAHYVSKLWLPSFGCAGQRGRRNAPLRRAGHRGRRYWRGAQGKRGRDRRRRNGRGHLGLRAEAADQRSAPRERRVSRADAMRVAILAHSTNPRGGVVHALELGDALVRLGHEAIVHAPDARGSGFFRSTLCGSALVPASPVEASIATMVETRIAEYLRYFEN